MADNGGNAPTEESSLLKGPDKKLPKSTYFSDATLVEIILLCLAILTSCLWLINLLFSGKFGELSKLIRVQLRWESYYLSVRKFCLLSNDIVEFSIW